jgi:hypothetical protein
VKLPYRALFGIALVTWCAAPAHAELIRIEVISRTAFVNGEAFGPAGPYELIIGVAYFAVDPDNPANQTIVDLALAPRDADGRVVFSADVQILRPIDPSRGNGTLLVSIVNRGERDGVAARAAGEMGFDDEFAMERGFSLAWVGWQFDVAPELVGLHAPVATGAETLTARLTHRITDPASMALPTPYPAHDPDGPGHALAVRDGDGAEFVEVPRDQWSFARMEGGALVADRTRVHLDADLETDAGKLYLLTYTTADPPIAGLGFASIRDFVAYAKHGGGELVSAEHAIGFGFSQSGRYLRDFLRDGFNADEHGRAAFDGVIPIIAGAGGGDFNFRAAQPTVGTAFGAEPAINDRFPFAHLPQTDPFSGTEAGLLDRVRAAGVAPKIFEVNASSEYDDRGAALIHTLADGSADAPVPDNVRIYTLLGAPHGGNAISVRATAMAYTSPVNSRFLVRALQVAMHEWIADGIEPPASRYPRIADGTLVPYRPDDFPAIPGIRRPPEVYRIVAADFGPRMNRGIREYPPRALGEYPVLVPALDGDGNESGGVRMPEVSVPLATYAGWNVEPTPRGPRLMNLLGSYIPFPLDRAARAATGDPRASIEERYADKADYLRRFAAAASELVDARLLLEIDIGRMERIAEERWEFHQGDPAIVPGAGQRLPEPNR